MLKYYCIPSCDKCRKARELLRVKNIDHIEVNYRKDFDAADLQSWIDSYGLDAVLNTRSTHFRKLDEDARAALAADPVPQLMAEPAMLYRPVLDFGDRIVTAGDALAYLDQA